MKNRNADVEKIKEVYFSLLYEIAKDTAEESDKPVKQIMIDLIEEAIDMRYSSNLALNNLLKKQFKADLEEAWPLE